MAAVKKISDNRKLKETAVSEVSKSLETAEVIVVTQNNGLTVEEVTDLRRKARAAGATYKVEKNTLVKLAIKDGKFAKADNLLSGPTAITYSKDPVAAAKVINNFSKTNEKLVILGGVFGGNALDVDAVKTLASLPSLDEVRAKIIGLLKAPATKIACVLTAPAAQTARVIGAYANKK